MASKVTERKQTCEVRLQNLPSMKNFYFLFVQIQ